METIYTAHLHGFPNLTQQNLQAGLSEENLLSLIIVLGSSVSLVGLVFAFITYSLFSDLRNLSGTTLMNLLAALFMTQLLYVIGVGGVTDSRLCVALAFSLHYMRLCIFTWMLIMTHLMYTQFNTNLHLMPIDDRAIGRQFIRYSMFGWGLPLVFLGAGVAIQYHDKGGKIFDILTLKRHNCWFLDKNSFIYGLLVPVIVIVLVTFSYLVRSMIVSRYIISMQVDKRIRDKMCRKRTLQIVLFTKMTIFLAIVMILATATTLINSDALRISYHIVQGLQGIVVALLVTCNCQVLKLYTKSMTNHRGRNEVDVIGGGGASSTMAMKSTSLQLLTWDQTPELV